MTDHPEKEAEQFSFEDPLTDEAAQIVTKDGQVSFNKLERQLKIGYFHTEKLLEEMEQKGIIAPKAGCGPQKAAMSFEKYCDLFHMKK